MTLQLPLQHRASHSTCESGSRARLAGAVARTMPQCADRRPASAEATAACQSVSLQAAQQTFTAGLKAAAAFMAQAVQPATAAARERHAAELQQWLASRHCSLTTCSPEALLAYVTMH